MASIQSVCVFCSSSNRIPSFYLETGHTIGRMLAERHLHVIYGGGNCGVMGAVAKGALTHGGKVTGVYPHILRDIEPAYDGLTELIIVPDMHTRKLTMFNRADAFIILPGGFGTMDETFEVITWKQLHTHNKPIVFYNQEGYWDHWIKLTNHFIELGFASEKTASLYTVVNTLEDIFSAIAS